MIYVFWTVAGEEEAGHVVRQLLEEGLVACASIVCGVRSVFRWEGKVEEKDEVKVILKSQEKHFGAICGVIREMGSYEVPEVVAVKVSEALPEYAAWVKAET